MGILSTPPMSLRECSISTKMSRTRILALELSCPIPRKESSYQCPWLCAKIQGLILVKSRSSFGLLEYHYCGFVHCETFHSWAGSISSSERGLDPRIRWRGRRPSFVQCAWAAPAVFSETLAPEGRIRYVIRGAGREGVSAGSSQVRQSDPLMSP